jgi:hypothetical protein
MATWKTFRVADVVTEIDEEVYVLLLYNDHWFGKKKKRNFFLLLSLKETVLVVLWLLKKKKIPPYLKPIGHLQKTQFYSSGSEKLKRQQFFVIDGHNAYKHFNWIKGSIIGQGFLL